MGNKKALIFWGGWDGHQPELVSVRFGKMLEKEGFEVNVVNSQEPLQDLDYLKSLDLIIPLWTMGRLEGNATNHISKAVASGVGMVGSHGGMCDAFRDNVEWQFITGGNWVSHPGGGIEYKVNIKNSSNPIVEGINDFTIRSEQYYLHYDPVVEILATTRFPLANWYHAANGYVDMPVVWTKRWGLGRIFYTSLGHNDCDFEIPEAAELVRRGMLWASSGKEFAAKHGLDASIYENSAKMF